MDFENGFDAEQQGEMRTFDPLPEGKYLAAITASEEKQVKAKPGREPSGATYLALTFTVLEGKYKDRNLWANLNLNNPNSETVRIAKCELGSICKAVGVLKPKSSEQLHGLPLTLSVKLKKREDNGEITNAIKGYANKNEAGPRAPSEAKADRLSAAAEAGSKAAQAPWAKKP